MRELAEAANLCYPIRNGQRFLRTSSLEAKIIGGIFGHGPSRMLGLAGGKAGTTGLPRYVFVLSAGEI